MTKETTTGDLIQLADCPKCGYSQYVGLVHHCPTAPKPEKWQWNNRVEIYKEPTKFCEIDENELTPEQWRKYYKEIGLE